MTFALNTYLAERKALVEEHLFACLPAAEARPAPLSEALRHAVLSGGRQAGEKVFLDQDFPFGEVGVQGKRHKEV